MSEKITKDTMIGELVMKHRSAVLVLSEHGFHCIGCPASQMETVEEGARAHGMDDKGVAELIDKLNTAIEKEKKAEHKSSEDGTEKSD